MAVHRQDAVEILVIAGLEPVAFAEDQKEGPVRQRFADQVEGLAAEFGLGRQVARYGTLLVLANLSHDRRDRLAHTGPCNGGGKTVRVASGTVIQVLAQPSGGFQDLARRRHPKGRGRIGGQDPVRRPAIVPFQTLRGFLVILRAPLVVGGRRLLMAQMHGVFGATVIAPEHPGGLVDGLEGMVVAANRFGRSQEQRPARLDRVVKDRHRRLLQLVAEIDQQVAARQQVDVRKRWVADDAVHREPDHVTDLGRDLEMAVARDRVGLAHVFGNVGQRGLGIGPFARDPQHLFVDVGGEDLDVHRPFLPTTFIGKQHRDGIGFLAAGTAGHPDADIVLVAGILDHRADRGVAQHLEMLCIAEEPGDVDQQVPEQQFAFPWVGPDVREVLLGIFQVENLNPPLHPPDQRGLLVAREIMTDEIPHHGADIVEVLLDRVGQLGVGLVENGMRVIGPDRLHDLRRAAHEIHQAGILRRGRHAVVFRGFRLLHDAKPAMFLDGAQPHAAIGAGARQDHAGREPSLVDG